MSTDKEKKMCSCVICDLCKAKKNPLLEEDEHKPDVPRVASNKKIWVHPYAINILRVADGSPPIYGTI